MKVTEEQVSHVASLARLQLADDEARLYATQLAQLLDYFEQLDELDTTGVQPTAHVLALQCRRRADSPAEDHADTDAADDTTFEARGRLLRQAPRSDEGFFVVPKVIDNE